MKRTILLFIFAAAAVSAFGATYQIDSAHSKAGFAVKHMMVSTVRGDFSNVKGTVDFDAANPDAGKIDITIDAASINTGQPKRDEHLRSADFFDVSKYPSLTFVSNRISRDSSGIYTVDGTLTMHGVAKPVTLRIEASPEMKDSRGGGRIGATATTKLNRKDWGLTWNRALEAGGVTVGDEVAVTIDVEMVRR